MEFNASNSDVSSNSCQPGMPAAHRCWHVLSLHFVCLLSVDSCVPTPQLLHFQLSQSKPFPPTRSDEAPDQRHLGIAVVQYHWERADAGEGRCWRQGMS